MEADKSPGLKLVAGDSESQQYRLSPSPNAGETKSADSIVLGQRPLVVRPRKSQGFSSSPKVGEKKPDVPACRVVTQSCPTLCSPMDCSLPGSSVHGISQARVLEWVAISFSRGSSWPRDQTWVSSIASRRFTIWATREAQLTGSLRRGAPYLGRV